MSIPTGEVALKDYLLNHDDEYRELASEHRRFEARLDELASLTFPNEDERIEETLIKKKKLLLKDQMHAIASRYRARAIGH